MYVIAYRYDTRSRRPIRQRSSVSLCPLSGAYRVETSREMNSQNDRLKIARQQRERAVQLVGREAPTRAARSATGAWKAGIEIRILSISIRAVPRARFTGDYDAGEFYDVALW